MHSTLSPDEPSHGWKGKEEAVGGKGNDLSRVAHEVCGAMACLTLLWLDANETTKFTVRLQNGYWRLRGNDLRNNADCAGLVQCLQWVQTWLGARVDSNSRNGVFPQRFTAWFLRAGSVRIRASLNAGLSSYIINRWNRQLHRRISQSLTALSAVAGVPLCQLDFIS